MIRKRKNDTVLRTDREAELLPYLMEQMHLTRTSGKQLLSHRRVQVNGVTETRHNLALHTGDEVKITSSKGNTELKHPKLRIVYEDDYLIVAEKREGLLTVAARQGSSEMTAFSILKSYVRRQNGRNNIYVVHRLDRETSGVLVFAKSAELQEYMRTYWKQLVTERVYMAVAEGLFEEKEGTIRSWFTEDKRNAVVYSSPVDDGGDLAITHYKVVKEQKQMPQETGVKPLSLVELRLDTGRTNQIRVHLASKGHPVVGDRKYGHGNEFSPADRLCLHARVLEFIHPATEEKVRFESPVPKKMTSLVRS